MKTPLLVFALLMLFAGCVKFDTSAEGDPVFSGRVSHFYYLDQNDKVSGFTRHDQALPGTSAMTKEDVYIEVYEQWVVVKLLNRKESSYIVPRERVRSIVVGTKAENELNPGKSGSSGS